MNKLIIITALLIFSGCKNAESAKSNKKEPGKADLVRYYYEKSFKLKLPLAWENTKGGLPVNESKILRPTAADSVLFGPGTGNMTPILGVIPDTSSFFIFLSTYTGDDIMPVLYVFDKKGNKNSSEILGYGCGGADCGFACNNGIFTLENKNSFYSTQEAYSVDCSQETSERDTSSVEFYKVKTTGYINSKGKIVLNKEQTLERRKVNWDSDENPFNGE
jgi:hypothetical protein